MPSPYNLSSRKDSKQKTNNIKSNNNFRSSGIHLPISPYDKNLLTDVRARPVIGPVVSSDRMTSRNGLRNSLGAISSRPEIMRCIQIMTNQTHRNQLSKS